MLLPVPLQLCYSSGAGAPEAAPNIRLVMLAANLEFSRVYYMQSDFRVIGHLSATAISHWS